MKKVARMFLFVIVMGCAACGIAMAGPLENANEAVQVAVQEAEQNSSRQPASPDIAWQETSDTIDPNTGNPVGKQNQQDQQNPSNW